MRVSTIVPPQSPLKPISEPVASQFQSMSCLKTGTCTV